MPRMSPAATAAPPPTTLVASAARLPTKINAKHRTRTRSERWQAQAWMHYDICGELRYGANWFANALSRARIYAAKRQPDGSLMEITTGKAHAALEELFADAESQAMLMKAMGPHYFVGGEWYLVGRSDPDDPSGPDIWEVVSPNEVKIIGGKWVIDHGDGTKIELNDDDFITRMWNPHPRHRSEPDSPVRAVLPVLEEIRLLTAHISAQVRSRLAGAGVLFLPSQISFSGPPGKEGDVNEGDEFIGTLYEAMQASIDDPGDPAALVPIVVQADGEYLDKVNHLTFWSDLEQTAAEQREAAMRRLALGLDLPPEVLTGTGDVNHWGAWAIDESTIKSHIEPALEVICAGLTRGFLRNIEGVDPDIVIAWDTAALRLRPNRSKEALELYDRGELKGSSLLRETGFDASDAPDDDERKQWLVRKIASGSATPEQVEAALHILGIEITTTATGEPRETRPDPSLLDHPEQGMPQDDPNRYALLAACDVLCMRALERAGNRIKGKFKVNPPNIPAHDLYRFIAAPPDCHNEVLADAWPTLPRAVEGYGANPGVVQQALDAYCRNLLISQGEHTKDAMAKYLHQVGL